jgi:hypothetical protein
MGSFWIDMVSKRLTKALYFLVTRPGIWILISMTIIDPFAVN